MECCHECEKLKINKNVNITTVQLPENRCKTTYGTSHIFNTLGTQVGGQRIELTTLSKFYKIVSLFSSWYLKPRHTWSVWLKEVFLPAELEQGLCGEGNPRIRPG
jgi:hypothetical protein